MLLYIRTACVCTVILNVYSVFMIICVAFECISVYYLYTILDLDASVEDLSPFGCSKRINVRRGPAWTLADAAARGCAHGTWSGCGGRGKERQPWVEYSSDMGIQWGWLCTCIHIHTYIHACMHTCMHACMHTYIHTYIDTYIYIHTNKQTNKQTNIHTYKYIYTYIYIYV